MLKKMLKPLGLLILALVLVLVAVAAFLPLPADAVLPPEKYGAGASSVEPSYSGLQRNFPPLNVAADHPDSADKAELGRLLFYDPALSKDNDLACATCHHPDYSFTDGKARAVGAGGVALNRNAMSLWNVGYSTAFFWDGRAATLEEQSQTPLTHADEMAADPQALAAELRAIPEYALLFSKAFGGDATSAVTFENTQRALAAFERTLLSHDSPFDRYAAGQVDALTSAQRRGLGVFRSAATRCFECHAAPTFGSDNFFVTGVPDVEGQPHDAGRKGVAADSLEGAFKAPTLRNIALTAPYMHNGSFQTLEEVVDFYAKGGGAVHGAQNLDRHILGFDLNAQERADLVAFLYALTDESQLPSVPTTVPSGLPVVGRQTNPAHAVVKQINAPQGSATAPFAPHIPTTITVAAGETIQSAVDRAGPGDTILVPVGVYHERVVLDISGLKFFGIPNAQGEWPTLDGENKLAEGVIASGNNFEMAYFRVKNYTSDGVLVEGVTGVHLHDLYTENTGVYGVYPVRSTNVLLERLEATLTNDAGIYAGKCENVIVRDSVAYGNVIGIEVENTVNAEIYNNHTYSNALGIFVDLLPQLPSKVSMNTKVYNNIVEDNNILNNAPPDSTQSLVRTGTGILLLGTDNAEVYNNTIRGNKTGGIGVFNLAIGFDKNEIDVGPNPEHNYIHDNVIENNGFDADPFIKNLLGSGYNIIWDGSGVNNRFDQPGVSSFPPALPSKGWPDPLYNLYWRAVNFVVGLIG